MQTVVTVDNDDGLTVLAVVVFFVPIIIFAAMAIASRRARRDRGF